MKEPAIYEGCCLPKIIIVFFVADWNVLDIVIDGIILFDIEYPTV